MDLLHLKLALDLEPADIEASLTIGYDSRPVQSLYRDLFIRSYNLGPSSLVPVLRQQTETDRTRVLHVMRWGLLPHYATEDSIAICVANSQSVVNGSKPLWTALRARRRCAVVCQGFYVWRKVGKKLAPFYFKHPDSRLVLLAGLYDIVQIKDTTIHSFTPLVTSDKNHSKCLTPVVFQTSAALTSWLDTSSLQWDEALAELVAPSTKLDTLMSSCQILPRIEHERSSSPSMILPISERSDGIKAAFARQPATPSRARMATTPLPDTSRTPARRLILTPGSGFQKTAKTPKPPSTPSTLKRRRSRSPSIEVTDHPPSSPSASAATRKRQKLTRTANASRR